MEVIGNVEQLGISNLSVIRNGIIQYPFQRRVSYDKCWKKLVKGVGIICVNFYVGRGQYPPYRGVCCGGCYVKHPKDEFPKYGNESGGY